MYKVILTGVREGVARQDAVKSLAALFKTTPEQVEKLLATSGHILKKGVTEEVAGKYKAAIEAAGGACRFELESTQAKHLQVDLPEKNSVPQQKITPSHAATAAPLPATTMQADIPSSLAHKIGKKIGKTTSRNKAYKIGVVVVLLMFGVALLAITFHTPGVSTVLSSFAVMADIEGDNLRNKAANGSSKTLKKIQDAANSGDTVAEFELGVLYDNGQGVPQDYAQAASWYRKAADQGNAGAQYSLGLLYDDGRGVPQDYAQAASWYRKAADQGDAGAQYNLGVDYAHGQGVPQDYATAEYFFEKAAAQGHQGAARNLRILRTGSAQ